jgi:hypothetical protein
VIHDFHLWVGASDTCDGYPQTKHGNPKIGKFPYSASLDNNWDLTTDYTWCRPMSEFQIDPTCTSSDQTQPTCAAAHAVVKYGDQEETAWAGGTNIGKSWAMMSGGDFTCDCDVAAPTPAPTGSCTAPPAPPDSGSGQQMNNCNKQNKCLQVDGLDDVCSDEGKREVCLYHYGGTCGSKSNTGDTVSHACPAPDNGDKIENWFAACHNGGTEPVLCQEVVGGQNAEFWIKDGSDGCADLTDSLDSSLPSGSTCTLDTTHCAGGSNSGQQPCKWSFPTTACSV